MLLNNNQSMQPQKRESSKQINQNCDNQVNQNPKNQQQRRLHRHRRHKKNEHQEQNVEGERGRDRGRGRCRGWERGRGRGSWKQKQINFKKKEKKQSHSSSSSGMSLHKVKGQMKNMSIQQQQAKTKAKIQISNVLQNILFPYQLRERPKQKIYNFVLKNYQRPEELDSLIQAFYRLQEEQPEYFKNLSIVKIFKILIKKKYVLEDVCEKLDKQLQIKNKKLEIDYNFSQKFPKPFQIQFYQKQQLMELDLSKTLFLFDCDNIIPKQKVLRFYYESRKIQEKAQAQVRLHWAVSEAVEHAEIFFDYKYPQNIYSNISQAILSPEERNSLKNVPVHFADKDIDPQAIADTKIISRLKQIITNKQYGFVEKFIIVSADRELAQVCRSIAMISQTSGQFIFKFLKQSIKRKISTKPEMKGIVKRIFN